MTPHTPGPCPGGRDRAPEPGSPAAELHARAVDGAAALVELLGGDLSVPRLAGLPERFVEAMRALVPGASPGASLPHGRTVPQTVADILTVPSGTVPPADPPDDRGDGPTDRGDGAGERGELEGFGHVITCATAFTAVCDRHLMPFAGVVHLAHDPGPGGAVVPRNRLGWLSVVLARGLVSEEAIAARAVHALRTHLGGDGTAAWVRITAPCPVRHPRPQAPPRLTGTFTGTGGPSPLGRAFTRWAKAAPPP